MTDDTTDGGVPVDFAVIEFPTGQQDFSGEVADELGRLVESGIIRLIDAKVLIKDADGGADVVEFSDLEGLDALEIVEADLAEMLADEDVADLADAMEPGSVAGVIVYENLWAAPFFQRLGAPVAGSSQAAGSTPRSFSRPSTTRSTETRAPERLVALTGSR